MFGCINKRKLRRTRGKIFRPLSRLGQNCNRAQKDNFHTLQHIFKWTIKCPQHEGDASQEERPLLARKSRAMLHQSRIVNCQPPGARALRSVDRGHPHVPERGHGEYLQTTVLRMNIFVGDIIYRFSARVNECEVEKRRGG